jgi:hypothetical protein
MPNNDNHLTHTELEKIQNKTIEEYEKHLNDQNGKYRGKLHNLLMYLCSLTNNEVLPFRNDLFQRIDDMLNK